MPLGACILCPLMEYRSQFFASKGTFKKPWTPSTWSSASGALRLSILRIASASFTAPTSLFTCITDTRRVSGVMRPSSLFRSIMPVLSTGASTTSYWQARDLYTSYTEGCSVEPTIILPLPRIALRDPSIAILLLSVPPEVNIISSGPAFMALPIVFRAPFTALSSRTAGE